MTLQLFYKERALKPKFIGTIPDIHGVHGEAFYQPIRIDQVSDWELQIESTSSPSGWSTIRTGNSGNSSGVLIPLDKLNNNKLFRFRARNNNSSVAVRSQTFHVYALEIFQEAEDFSVASTDSFQQIFSCSSSVDKIELQYRNAITGESWIPLSYGLNTNTFVSQLFSDSWISAGAQFRFVVTWHGVEFYYGRIANVTEIQSGSAFAITTQPQDITVTSPSSLTVTAGFSGGLKPYSVEILFNESVVSTFSTVLNQATWTVASTTGGYGDNNSYDNGIVKFRVTDATNTTLTSRGAWTQINPVAPPIFSILTQPVSQTIVSGGTVTRSFATSVSVNWVLEFCNPNDTSWSVVNSGTGLSHTSPVTLQLSNTGRRYRFKLTYMGIVYYTNTMVVTVNALPGFFVDSPSTTLTVIDGDPMPGMRWETDVDVFEIIIQKQVIGPANTWVNSSPINIGPFSSGTISSARLADISVDPGTYRLRASGGATTFYSNPFQINVVASLPPTAPVIDDIHTTSIVTKRIKFSILDGVTDTDEDYSSLEIIDSAGTSYGPNDQFVDPASGLWKISPNGMSIQFIPFYGFVGDATVDWRIADLTGTYSRIKTITCSVLEVGSNYINFVFGPTLMASTTEEQRDNILRSEKYFNYILRQENNSVQNSIYGGSTNGLIVEIDVVPPAAMTDGIHVLAQSEAVQGRTVTEHFKPFSGSIEINSAHLDEIFSMPTYYIDRMIVHGVIHILGFNAQMFLNQGITLTLPPTGMNAFNSGVFNQLVFDAQGDTTDDGFLLSGGPLHDVFVQWEIESNNSSVAINESAFNNASFNGAVFGPEPDLSAFESATFDAYTFDGEAIDSGLVVYSDPLLTDSSHWKMTEPGDMEIMFPTFGPNIIPPVGSWTLALLKDLGYDIDIDDITDHRYGQPGWSPFEGDEPQSMIFTMSLMSTPTPQPILMSGNAIINDPDVPNLKCGCGA